MLFRSGVEDFKPEIKIDGGLLWEVDAGAFCISFYITDITSDSLSLCQTSRVEYNGDEVYQEGVVYYKKVTTNE